MSREADTEQRFRIVVAGVKALLDGEDYHTVGAVIGILLTEFIAAHPADRRERVLSLFVNGVRDEAPNAKGAVRFDDAEKLAWH